MMEILTLTNEETARCPRCGETKDILHFYRRGDRYQSWCIDCQREYKKTRHLMAVANMDGYSDVRLAEVPQKAKEMGKKQRTDLRNYLRFLAARIK